MVGRADATWWCLMALGASDTNKQSNTYIHTFLLVFSCNKFLDTYITIHTKVSSYAENIHVVSCVLCVCVCGGRGTMVVDVTCHVDKWFLSRTINTIVRDGVVEIGIMSDLFVSVSLFFYTQHVDKELPTTRQEDDDVSGKILFMEEQPAFF